MHAAVLESVAELRPFETWCHEGYTLEEAGEYVSWWVQGADRGDSRYFAVCAGDRYLGSCGLSPIDREHRTAGLGFWVRSGATGRGVATRAARLVAGHGFDDLGLHRIEIMAAEHNLASRRVAEKLGARLEGTLRRRLVLQGTPTDVVVYSLVDEEWPPAPAGG